MAKRNRTINLDKIGKWIKDGRGQGHGKYYKPWIGIRDVPSVATSYRQLGWKTGRMHELLSGLEEAYLLILDSSPVVVDIREQYPLLPLEETLDIAERLGIGHPKDQVSRDYEVMTTDFIVDVVDNGVTNVKARTIKPSDQLQSRRKIEKFEIERIYWKERGIDWGIVTENEIPKELVSNIMWLHTSKEIIHAPKCLNAEIIMQIESELFESIVNSPLPLSKAAVEFDKQVGFKAGASLWVIKHYIANRIWEVDLNLCIDLDKPFQISQFKKRNITWWQVANA